MFHPLGMTTKSVDVSDRKSTGYVEGDTSNNSNESKSEVNGNNDHQETEPTVHTTTIPQFKPPPPPPPPNRRTLDTVMNDLIVQPTKKSADVVLGQVGALTTDVVADVKDVGHFVLQPVVDMAKATAAIPMAMSGHGKENDDDQNHSDDDTIDMFAKTAQAIFNSVVIYAIADIRTLIRNHRDEMIGDPDMIQQLLTLPITDVHVMMIIMQNLSLLQEKMKKGEIDFYISAVLRYRKELAAVTQSELSQQENGTASTAAAAAAMVAAAVAADEIDNRINDDPIPTALPTPPPPAGEIRRTRIRRRSMYESIQQQQQQQNTRIPNTLEVFDDENSLKELVYGISINRYVCFRINIVLSDGAFDIYIGTQDTASLSLVLTVFSFFFSCECCSIKQKGKETNYDHISWFRHGQRLVRRWEILFNQCTQSIVEIETTTRRRRCEWRWRWKSESTATSVSFGNEIFHSTKSVYWSTRWVL